VTTDANPKSLDGYRVFVVLQERIDSGEYPPETWLPAERVLADELGVNRAVVRSAIHRLAESGFVTRERGHRPWVCKGATRGQFDRPSPPNIDSRNLAAILPQHPVYHASSQILNSINLELRTREAPFRLMVFNSYDETIEASAEYERRALVEVEESGAAGVIIWHVGLDATLPQLVRLRNRGIPVIFVDRYPEGFACDFVGIDNCGSAREAVNYLISLGHRRIAYLTSSEPTTAVVARKCGYLEALRVAGITPRPEWIYDSAGGTLPYLKPAVEQFFGSAEPPSVVFTLNDALAHYFIIEAEAAGYAVPNCVSVMGFDDLERYLPRPALLTTMHQPFDRIGQQATQLLLRRLDTPDPVAMPYQHILLSAPLVERGTCLPTGKET